ncbi:hypothetical protein B296_00049338 [Ensete ventricosum]|uniref:Uncharacterized protein n=1 Tax=Ensete ventricosum TaxID=4639 RepID=A0A426YR42_ENSVE|nr:hypothetical protein B296_00049338 [Ensete ventricosum]
MHQRTASESFLLEEQPSWLDDLLDEPETPPLKAAHGRSSSDSFAYLDTSCISWDTDSLAQEGYRHLILTLVPSWGSQEFDYLFRNAISSRGTQSRVLGSSKNKVTYPSSSLASAKDKLVLPGSSSATHKSDASSITVIASQVQEELVKIWWYLLVEGKVLRLSSVNLI